MVQLIVFKRLVYMIVKFSGIDGCGKSTIIKSVEIALKELGKTVTVISEFAGLDYENDKISNDLRCIIENKSNKVDEFEREVLFTLISRRINLYRTQELNNSFDFVLIDRSHLDNYTYGLVINKDYRKTYDTILENINFANIKVFWLNTNLDTCLTRINSRNELSINEKKGKPFFKEILKIYKDFAIQNKCKEINGDRSVKEITSEIINEILAQ